MATAEYLRAIREICDRHGILLIFDEILSGFRTGMSCAQGYYGVTPDICLLGKALTNGVPLAAITGKERIMMKIMELEDPVVAGGTFSGNLFGCAAGPAAMKIMEAPGFFEAWQSRVANFVCAIRVVVADVPAHDSPQMRFSGVGCCRGDGCRDDQPRPSFGYGGAPSLRPAGDTKYRDLFRYPDVSYHT